MEYVMVFASTHTALKAESALKSNEVAFRLIPAPKAITGAHCGLAITIGSSVFEDVKAILRRSRALFKAVYFKEGDRYVEV